MKYKQGIYKVKNKEKYIGTKDPTYRSSWELRVFEIFDLSEKVVKWGSETVVIPYISPLDGRTHRYMVDLVVEYLDKDGNSIKQLIEIKPLKETIPPKNTKNKKRSTLIREVLTYQKNLTKWKFAQKWGESRGMKFRILTEKIIFS